MTDETQDVPRAGLLRLTVEITAAQVANNNVPASELPGLIRDIYGALAAVQRGEGPLEKLAPAVPVKKSVNADAITCLECGKSLRLLKRHLRADHGVTPQEYRERWGLQADYPMVAPRYAKQRSRLAKDSGLGRKRRTSVRSESG